MRACRSLRLLGDGGSYGRLPPSGPSTPQFVAQVDPWRFRVFKNLGNKKKVEDTVMLKDDDHAAGRLNADVCFSNC